MKYRVRPVIVDAFLWDGSQSAYQRIMSVAKYTSHNLSLVGADTPYTLLIRTIEDVWTRVPYGGYCVIMSNGWPSAYTEREFMRMFERVEDV